MFADQCVFVFIHVCVYGFDVCVNERLSVRAEVETAFGFGALLRREKKKKHIKDKKNSPHVTDGNFSGPTMLQSISLY